MSFVILDLEWNTTYSKAHGKYVNEIIEFGAVKLDNRLNITEEFSMLVKPTFSKGMSHHVKDLVNIDFDEVLSAKLTFPEVLDCFKAFLGDSTLLTWSNSDLHTLIENSDIHLLEKDLPFIKAYCDLQQYCEYELGVSTASRVLGLNACAQMLGIVDDQSKQNHRALEDARLSFRCFKALFNRRHFEEFAEECDEEFFRKLTFKQKYITSLKNPVLDHSQMFFDCPECGVRCIRKSKWNVYKKAFLAFFVCPECKGSFTGRVFAKLKYDGVVFSKKIISEKPKEETPSEE